MHLSETWTERTGGHSTICSSSIRESAMWFTFTKSRTSHTRVETMFCKQSPRSAHLGD
ncbi:unnamed protein product [Dicrocoelium dendriticum]|nr:unnamed protein product [Dicrocoelium dendriticum]